MLDGIIVMCIGIALLCIGYYMGMKDAQVRFVKLIGDMETAGLLKIDDVLSYLKGKTNK